MKYIYGLKFVAEWMKKSSVFPLEVLDVPLAKGYLFGPLHSVGKLPTHLREQKNIIFKSHSNLFPAKTMFLGNVLLVHPSTTPKKQLHSYHRSVALFLAPTLSPSAPTFFGYVNHIRQPDLTTSSNSWAWGYDMDFQY